MSPSFYGEVLTEHFSHPQFYGELEKFDQRQLGFNQSCGDRLELMIRWDGERIGQMSFVGEGCALSRAAADIVCGLFTGKTRKQARELYDIFVKLIAGELLTGEEETLLGEAVALREAAAMPLRTKCVQLAWSAAAAML